MFWLGLIHTSSHSSDAGYFPNVGAEGLCSCHLKTSLSIVQGIASPGGVVDMLLEFGENISEVWSKSLFYCVVMWLLMRQFLHCTLFFLTAASWHPEDTVHQFWLCVYIIDAWHSASASSRLTRVLCSVCVKHVPPVKCNSSIWDVGDGTGSL